MAPPVAFVIFAYDGRGYTPVVMDLLAAEGLPLVPFLAHEFHHVFRNRLARVDADAAPPEAEDLWWVLSQLELEGIADQVGNAGFFAGELPITVGDGFRLLVEERPAVLAAADSLLTRLDQAPGDAAAVGAELRKRLPWSGHPTGFYMASLIRARLGLDALVATTGDPFAFFRAYQRAVTQFDATDPDPADDAIPTAFSPAAMRTLDRLERGFRS